jgi:hypothetical protein
MKLIQLVTKVRSDERMGPVRRQAPTKAADINPSSYERLDQGYFAVEIGFLLCVQFQSYAAGGGDAFQHRQRVAGILRIFETGNHRLRRPNLLGKLGLGQARMFPHLADE